MFIDQWNKLHEDEKYILASGLLNPVMRSMLQNQVDECNHQLANLTIPGSWDQDSLVNFMKQYQRKKDLRYQAESLLALVDQAQKHIQEMRNGNV